MMEEQLKKEAIKSYMLLDNVVAGAISNNIRDYNALT